MTAKLLRTSTIAAVTLLASLLIISYSAANWRLGANFQLKHFSSQIFIEKTQLAE